MAFEDIDRRRFLLLGLLTLIAIPAIYLVSQREAAEPTDTVAVSDEGAAAPVEDGPNRPALAPTDEDPTYLDGPVGNANPGVNEIAIPAEPESPPLELTASYRSDVPGVGTCLLREIGPGASVVVKNLDNGRKIACVTAQAPESQVAGLVVHADAFLRLADPTEAPIMVEVSQ